MIKVPTNIIELLALEERYNNAHFFASQSDNQQEVDKAEDFIIECEKVFTQCKVKFSYNEEGNKVVETPSNN